MNEVYTPPLPSRDAPPSARSRGSNVVSWIAILLAVWGGPMMPIVFRAVVFAEDEYGLSLLTESQEVAAAGSMFLCALVGFLTTLLLLWRRWGPSRRLRMIAGLCNALTCLLWMAVFVLYFYVDNLSAAAP